MYINLSCKLGAVAHKGLIHVLKFFRCELEALSVSMYHIMFSISQIVMEHDMEEQRLTMHNSLNVKLSSRSYVIFLETGLCALHKVH